jgi:hypothetical protein|tara:strand:- start:15007 stop:15228 length:222 start_codon:yes stop_codon:yes gene_type:complete
MTKTTAVKASEILHQIETLEAFLSHSDIGAVCSIEGRHAVTLPDFLGVPVLIAIEEMANANLRNLNKELKELK